MKRVLLVGIVLGFVGCVKQEENKKLEQDNIKTEISLYEQSENKVEIPKTLDVVAIAECAAAAMKSGQGIELYRPWADELTRRYSKIYSDQNQSEISSYTAERILDKKRLLESRGISTSVGFYKFYQQNCEIKASKPEAGSDPMVDAAPLNEEQLLSN